MWLAGEGYASTVSNLASKKKGTPEEKSRAEIVNEILRNVEKKMTGEGWKATLGDYIKLLQLQKEMKDEGPSEIKVSWIEPRNQTGE